MNTCNVIMAEPFSKDSTTYPYWQCFSTKSVKVDCDDFTRDKGAKSATGVMAITVSDSHHHQEYLSRRAIDLEDCHYFKKKWKQLTTQESHECLARPLIDVERLDQEKKETFWIFDKFKTKKGCASYFYGACNLKYLLRHGCSLNK